MSIKVNYTAYLVGDWKLIVEKHLFLLRKSGLYDDLNEFNIFAFPRDERLNLLVEKYDLKDKTKIVFLDENRYEFPAIIDLIQNPMDCNLYFHSKGVSQENNPKTYVPTLMWNDYMTYFNVVNHRTCEKLLQQFDACGVELGSSLQHPDRMHYCGNFWWSSRKHLEKIRDSATYGLFKDSKDRYDCETIVGSVDGKYLEMFNSGTDTPKTGTLYYSPMLRYDMDRKNFRVHVKYENAAPRVALVAIAKDEDNYLKEWVDYHLKIGFSEIFVYQNNWRYTRGDITDSRVHFKVEDGMTMQTRCYNGFISEYKDRFDFAVFIDIDEFLWLKNTKNISDFLKDHSDDDAIFVNWRLFGDNGLSRVQDGEYSVIRRFTRCSDKLHPLGKNILNMRKTGDSVLFHNPHILVSKDGIVRAKDPSGKRFTVSGTIRDNTIDEPCEIFHFRNKTFEELVQRRFNKMNPAASTMSKSHTDMEVIKSEFDEHNGNDVVNTELLEFAYGKREDV